jgi:hypothetical protein
MYTSDFTPIDLSVVPGFMNLVNDNKDTNNQDILKLNNVKCRSSNNQEYKIIRYDKHSLCIDLIPVYGLCRSIIVNASNKVVCFSPPKSLPSDVFMQKYPSNDDSSLVAQEFIEGTMINVFWDPNIGLTGAWEIATRNTVGATSSFYKHYECKSKTFRDMFLEAAKENNLILNNLNKNYCYSFVLQHPENRIVVPFKYPQLYLVASYTIINSSDNVSIISYPLDTIKQNNWVDTTIKFPEIYKWTSYSELIDKYASMNSAYNILGFMIYNVKTGERMKIRNPVYEEVRQLRGNQPKLQYQYLCLRQQGKVADFLKFYPENKKQLSSFRDQVHVFTNTLYNNYVSCYIKKEKPLIEFSEIYRTHMYTIHQNYMTNLKPQNMHVNVNIVIKYVNEMHPNLLMYCLNHNMRKRNVDTIIAESKI